MKIITTRTASLLTLAVALTASCLNAQQPGSLQMVLSTDVGTLADKFTGIARVMDGKYDYKPNPAVRSTAEVLSMIVMENGMLNATLTGAPPAPRPAAGAPAPTAAKMMDSLKETYATLKKTIEGMSDADMNATVKFFGRDTTKRSAIIMLLGDQHEHLGQMITYSRSNGIVPPWSK